MRGDEQNQKQPRVHRGKFIAVYAFIKKKDHKSIT